MNQHNQHTLHIHAQPRPEVMERVLRVVRHRGFNGALHRPVRPLPLPANEGLPVVLDFKNDSPHGTHVYRQSAKAPSKGDGRLQFAD